MRWVGAAAILYLLLCLVDLLVTNPNWEWDIVWDYLFSAQILRAVGQTILITCLAEVVGLVFGVALAIMRLSPNPVLKWSAAVYTWVFRGIPPLVLLLFIYFLSALVPTLSIGIPFGPSWGSWSTNAVITKLAAAVIGLGLAQAAYIAEIVRGGVLSVPVGQSRAALALGMPPGRVMRHIVLPQAMRVVIPPLGNEVISMLKATSLVSIIAYGELLTTVQVIYARNFAQIPLLLVAVIWYGILTTVATVIQSRVEQHMSRSLKSQQRPS
jgi:polar amino acid transport system permease protein